VGAEETCRHEFSRTYFEWGKIEVQDGHQSRPFWQVQECKKCGETRRESNRYYGDDMAEVPWKWTSRGEALSS
jgi:formylmethanofuran dehydrogenase subunit E